MIETRLLRQFIAVAQELHFHRAAERLNMAQPPLSQAIRRLEQTIGYALFERTNRSVALTAAGSAFLITAQHMLSSLDEGVANTRRVAQGLEGLLNLSFINLAPYPIALLALKTFRQASPGVAFSLKEATTAEQIEALEQGSTDIGFIRTPGRTTPLLQLEPLFSEPVVVALPAEHPLAQLDAVDLRALRDEPFVATARGLGQGWHDQLTALCQTAGFVPKVEHYVRQLHTLPALVACGFGSALVPASQAVHACTGVAFRPLLHQATPELGEIELLMAWNPSRLCPIRDRLVAHLRTQRALSN